MKEELEKAIKQHENSDCTCDLTEGGYGLCLAGQVVNSIILEKDFYERLDMH